MQMPLFALDKGTLLWPRCVTQRAWDSPESKNSSSIPRRSRDIRVTENLGSWAMTCFTTFPRWQAALHPRDELWVTRADGEFLRLVLVRSLQVRDAAQGSLCSWNAFVHRRSLGTSGSWHPTADWAYAWYCILRDLRRLKQEWPLGSQYHALVWCQYHVFFWVWFCALTHLDEIIASSFRCVPVKKNDNFLSLYLFLFSFHV